MKSQHPDGLFASLAIHCKHPETGEVGCWLFSGASHRNPGSSKTPVFPDLSGLFTYCKDNGWNQAGSNGSRYVYHSETATHLTIEEEPNLERRARIAL